MPAVSYPNFVGGSYQQPILNIDAEECINLYVENQEVPGAKAPVVLRGAPGTLGFFEFGIGPIRGIFDFNSETYIFSGSEAFVFHRSGIIADFGPIANDGKPVKMVVGLGGALILSGGQAYTVGTSTLIPVPSPPWVFAQDCAYSNGIYIVLEDNQQPEGGQFFISATNDPTSWSALEFSTIPNVTKAVALGTTHNEVWVFGTTATQPFYFNPQAVEFPFIANQQVAMEFGILGRDTLQNMNDTLFWVGQTTYGSLQAFMANGYLPQRISTYPIEQEWQSYAQPTNCVAWTFQLGGHSFYHLNFLGDNKSWRYDVSTNLWHRVNWRNPVTGAFGCHRANNHCVRAGVHLVGDRISSDVWILSPTTYSDRKASTPGAPPGDPLVALRRAPFPYQGGKRVFFPVFELISSPGVGIETAAPTAPEFNPAWMLRWSNNGGETWSPEFQLNLGEQGQFFARQRKINCGSGRNRVFEVSISADVPRVIIGAELPYGVYIE